MTPLDGYPSSYIPVRPIGYARNLKALQNLISFDVVNILTVLYTPTSSVVRDKFEYISRKFLDERKIAAIQAFKYECYCKRPRSNELHMFMKEYPKICAIPQDCSMWKLIEKI
jgi:hypothetical protein